MAVPKQRKSRANSRMGRSHWKLNTKQLTECPECHEAKLPHRICPSCGYYKGRQVKEVKE
jgi:large subunit ribosomal protein L32